VCVCDNNRVIKGIIQYSEYIKFWTRFEPLKKVIYKFSSSHDFFATYYFYSISAQLRAIKIFFILLLFDC